MPRPYDDTRTVGVGHAQPLIPEVKIKINEVRYGKLG